MSFVELKGLTKRYAAQPVVNGIDLIIERGQLVCLLGPSGCGKTTTLRLIAGFVAPSSGEIHVGGRVLSAASGSVPPEERGMSMIFQSYALWPHMTVAKNVAYGLSLRGIAKADMAMRVDRILAATKLSALAERYPAELSGGQQQRVALARALVVEPGILLLDEPLSNLDASLREEMRFEIRRLHEEFHYTTVYVTHDQSEAMTTADVIVIMNHGAIEQAGSPEDIYLRPTSRFVAQFMGGANVLNGRRVAADRVECAGVRLTCGSGEFAADGHDTTVCIRDHDIRVVSSPPDHNAVQAHVVRQVYLGSHRDYLLTLPDGQAVRVVTPAHQAIAEGEMVWLDLPAEHCRALAR